MSDDLVAGRTWKFGDNINTDLMLPSDVIWASEEEQARAVFRANRPGWLDEMTPGDIIIGGINFGTGSARPAARSLRTIGIGCLIADTINGLFFRSAVNFGLIAIECPGVSAAFEEGQTAEVSLRDFTVRNRDTGVVLQGLVVPDNLLAMMRTGGLFPILEKMGIIAPVPPKAAKPA